MADPIPRLPEEAQVVLKRRKQNDSRRIKRAKIESQRRTTRGDPTKIHFKRAESFIASYRRREHERSVLIRKQKLSDNEQALKTRPEAAPVSTKPKVAAAISSGSDGRIIFAIRTSSAKAIDLLQRQALHALRLHSSKSAVFMRLDATTAAQLRMLSAHTLWGTPSARMVRELLFKRARAIENGALVPLNDNRVVALVNGSPMDALSLLANVATTMQKQPGRAPQPVATPIRSVTLQNVIDSVVNECVRDGDSDLPMSSGATGASSTVGLGTDSAANCSSKSADVMDVDETSVFDSAQLSAAFAAVTHSWLCNGRVLHLHDPAAPNNVAAFQRVWCFGKPVLVSGCHRTSQKDLWAPRTFSKEYGTVQTELINCRTGLPLPNMVSLRNFWDGFENARKRTNRDSHGEPLILKLKDWPSGDDFQDLLPRHYRDLLASLPLADYTHRNGVLNLAGRLPDFFVRPDLGPKLYSAYGTARHPSIGSTNLHMDISDAVNLLMHVAVDGSDEAEVAMRYLETNPHVDADTLERVRSQKLVPGAVWHLFEARDASKLRAYLQRVASERSASAMNGNSGTSAASNGSGSTNASSDVDHDPIHDQQTYLDSEALSRLRREYGVLPYTIVQCVGDAIFIPAGTPHQVKNLQSCVKVALDFVSAEQVAACVQLTSEFRRLSKKHANHEDKLQIKNMIYHAVKDCVSVLEHST